MGTNQPKNLVLAADSGEQFFYARCKISQINGTDVPCRLADCSKEPIVEGAGRASCRRKVWELTEKGELAFVDAGYIKGQA